VYRLAQISVSIIDQSSRRVSRLRGSMADSSTRVRSVASRFSRTFYARGQTGQQLLLGAYQALEEQVAAGTVKMHTRSEMLDLVLVNGKAAALSRATS